MAKYQLGVLCHAPATYTGPPWDTTPEPPVTNDEIEQWFEFHPDATCSTRTARALALIERCRHRP